MTLTTCANSGNSSKASKHHNQCTRVITSRRRSKSWTSNWVTKETCSRKLSHWSSLVSFYDSQRPTFRKRTSAWKSNLKLKELMLAKSSHLSRSAMHSKSKSRSYKKTIVRIKPSFWCQLSGTTVVAATMGSLLLWAECRRWGLWLAVQRHLTKLQNKSKEPPSSREKWALWQMKI